MPKLWDIFTFKLWDYIKLEEVDGSLLQKEVFLDHKDYDILLYRTHPYYMNPH